MGEHSRGGISRWKHVRPKRVRPKRRDDVHKLGASQQTPPASRRGVSFSFRQPVRQHNVQPRRPTSYLPGASTGGTGVRLY